MGIRLWLSLLALCLSLGVIGRKSDIANAVLFLPSDAAAYISGQIIVVDGGSSVDLFKLGGKAL